MRSLRLIELPQKIEEPVAGVPGVCVFVTHVARAPSGLPRVRASLWHGAFGGRRRDQRQETARIPDSGGVLQRSAYPRPGAGDAP